MNLRTPIACLVTLSAAAFAAEPPHDVVFIDHPKVAATFAKGGSFEANTQYKVMAGHREGPGNVEIHDYDTDVFYIVDGTATLMIGGTPNGAKETSPGERRAPSTTGGKPYHLSQGDIIIIPPGVPHWTTEASKPYDYFVVKIVGPKHGG
jgi:quercetin dioxygenase-like cupin family protein